MLDDAGGQAEARGRGGILRSIADEHAFLDHPVDQLTRARAAVDQHEVRAALPILEAGTLAGVIDELLRFVGLRDVPRAKRWIGNRGPQRGHRHHVEIEERHRLADRRQDRRRGNHHADAHAGQAERL